MSTPSPAAPANAASGSADLARAAGGVSPTPACNRRTQSLVSTIPSPFESATHTCVGVTGSPATQPRPAPALVLAYSSTHGEKTSAATVDIQTAWVPSSYM